MALSADGKRVLIGLRGTDYGHNPAKLCDADTGKPVKTFDHHDEITSAALSADGQRRLIASENSGVLWDAESGKQLQTFKGHTGTITAVAFARRDSLIATASRDGTVRFWKPGREEPVFSFLSAGDDWIFWTPEGYYTSSPNGEGLIAWRVKDDSPQGYRVVGPEQFHKKFYRPDLFRHLLAELDLDKALALADKESGLAPQPASDIAKALPPRVSIIRPLQQDRIIKTEECELRRRGDAHWRQLRHVHATPSGRPALRPAAPLRFRGRARASTWKVKLPAGTRHLQVVVGSIKGSTGQSEDVEILREDEAEAPPTLLLLGIGITDYQKTNRKGAEYAAADAKRFVEAQVAHGKVLYPEPQILPLPDGKATKADVLRTFNELNKRTHAVKNPVTMIFLAGHGLANQQGDDFYFLTADSDPGNLRTTAISGAELKSALRDVNGKVLVLLDTCHSGAATQELSWGLVHECGVVMVCSSSGAEESWQSNADGGGYFTLALTDGLASKATRDKDGALYLPDLFAYVNRRVKELSNGQQRPYASELNRFDDVPLAKP